VNEAAPQIQKFSTGAKKSTRPSSSDKPVKQPSSTRAMALSQHRRREEIESHKKEEEQLKTDDAERKKKQERVSNCHNSHVFS